MARISQIIFPFFFSHSSMLFPCRKVFIDYILTFLFPHCIFQLKRCDVWNVILRNLVRVQIRRPRTVPGGSATRTTPPTGKVTARFSLSWRKDVILKSRIPQAYAAVIVNHAATIDYWYHIQRIDGSVNITAVLIMMSVTITCTPLQLVVKAASWVFKLWKK